MQNTPTRTVFSEITDFLATNPSPQEIIDYRLPEIFQTRALDLLDRNGEGELDTIEQEEMMDFVRIDEMMTLLKAKMKRKSLHYS